MQTMTLNDFLVWLTAGGAGIVLAFVLERIPAFQALTSAAKSWLTLALTVVIALAAWAALTYIPPELMAQVAPIFTVVAGVVVAWLGTQAGHAVDPARKP